MSKLIITQGGKDLVDMDIVIPAFKSLPFFERVKAKEYFLKYKIQQFKLDHVNLLVKLMNDYEIQLQV